MREIRFLGQVSAVIIVLMGTSMTVVAGPTIENGDFSVPGLSGWTLEFGTVTDGGGYALFDEDLFDLSSTLSQEFTIPALAMELSFDVVMTAQEDSGFVPDPFYTPWPDAFTASLLDPVTDDPLINNPGFTDFYYVDNTGYDETVATISGSTISLDISALAPQDVLLVFDLFGDDDGWWTSVSLDNVDMFVIPAPGALLLCLIGTGAVGLWRRSNR